MPHYIKVSQTASTNTYLSRLAATLPGGTVIYTPSQTAGRGQKGNSWESEDGKNLTFSMLLKRPPVSARDQFYLSEAAALAVVETLTAEAGDGFSVKWPNDVYWHDKKECGMLIENSLDGSDIATSIIGIGINVNQERFVSDAPNPVSLSQILGHDVDREEVFRQVLDNIGKCMQQVTEGRWEPIRTRYRQHLYRLGETHPYRFTDGHTEVCRLLTVTDDGHLELQAPGHSPYHLAFKEVRFENLKIK